ncbi:hypothetical protein OCS_06135 [Ophiocordyceps sinensis CO18]|uniref:Uncharacterized protein n=1 Tax=Ophiocordyceps sinensis (strain Co18 / CGMCC 3.14243) TaxID=911162 RepID=T5A6Z2_OPHSC|nr:hypothetical protein OCS_06135 [Ophiocordyceps sinensis CO18]
MLTAKASLQVIVSFVGTAFIIFLLLAANYLVVYDPTQHPFLSRDEVPAASGPDVHGAASCASCKQRRDPWRPNVVDDKFLGSVRGVSRRIGRRLPAPRFLKELSINLGQAFNETIITMCDLQIFTGAGILISGFLSLYDNLAAYHWQIIVYLAWFSTVSHLAGLTVIRSYLHAFPRKRNIRLALVAVVMLLLLVAMVPTQFFAWRGTASRFLPGTAAVCYFDMGLARRMWSKAIELDHDEARGTSPIDFGFELGRGVQQVVFAAILLIFGLFTRLIKAFSPLSRVFGERVRPRASRVACRLLMRIAPPGVLGPEPEGASPGFLRDMAAYLVFLPALASFYTLRMWLDLFGSMLSEVNCRSLHLSQNWRLRY